MKNAKQWWLTPGQQVIEVPEADKNEFVVVERHLSDFFGVTPDDIEFVFQTIHDNEQILALEGLAARAKVVANEAVTAAHFGLIDKLLSVGCVRIRIDSVPPAKSIAFWQESYETYGKIMQWITRMKIPPKTKFIMREMSTMRGWEQTAEAIVKGAMYSKNPDRHGVCPNCNSAVSFDEILYKRTCPSCQFPLA